MASANITVVGSLGADPELRFLGDGTAVANFSVAVTERVKNNDQWEDGDTTWYRVAVWRQLAENAVESLRKGDQVIVTGKLKNRPYEKDGETRYSLEITADELGASLRFATASMTKASGGSGGQRQSGGGQRSGGGRSGGQRSGGGRSGGGDPWGSATDNGGY